MCLNNSFIHFAGFESHFNTSHIFFFLPARIAVIYIAVLIM